MRRDPRQSRAQSGRRCTKELYRTESDAQTALDQLKTLNRSGDRNRNERRVQVCWSCGFPGYHLTSSRQDLTR